MKLLHVLHPLFSRYLELASGKTRFLSIVQKTRNRSFSKILLSTPPFLLLRRRRPDTSWHRIVTIFARTRLKTNSNSLSNFSTGFVSGITPQVFGHGCNVTIHNHGSIHFPLQDPLTSFVVLAFSTSWVEMHIRGDSTKKAARWKHERLNKCFSERRTSVTLRNEIP